MVSLRQLRSFIAVHEEGSFTAAALREGATQSGISQHVAQLEEELGTALFERHGRNVALTAAGRTYYEECIAALKRLDVAAQKVAAEKPSGPLRVGLMPTFTRSLLPPVLESFLLAAPAVQINITEAYSGVLTEMVRAGELDFAAVPAFSGTPGVSQRLLLRDREMLVRARPRATRSHRTIAGTVRLSELGPLKVVVPGWQNTRRGNIETYFAANGIEIAQRLELDAMMGTLQFVAASDFVAILPFIMMVSDLKESRFEIRPLEDPPLHSEFVLTEPARKAISPAAALFARLLKEEAARAQALFDRMIMSGASVSRPARKARGSRRLK
ncbi:LysR family transcriptional regulator [Bradyrhizobium cenepequi]|uniref:LysR family transcriptional regulator n=1 Tax=Bradyrhizobium cenepequi TaxID=2821403 RepID=UPI001CE24B07|nr:LysR family transcriptional regulator [Bradyrhizobium cenepequi]MCA6106210.1 LysR family transcriptional regulator [Bradyrhizobium cenepequi]